MSLRDRVRRLDETQPPRRRQPPAADARWAWFFDVDGTLVEIAATPSDIVVHDDLPHLIARLNVLSGGAVALITGRTISNVDEVIPVPGLSIAGQHGLEVRTASGSVDAAKTDADFAKIVDELSELSRRHPGLIVEPKGSSVALHYRRVPKLAGYAHRVIRSLESRYGPGLTVQKGKMVVELRAEGRDKGEAIQRLMKTEPFKGRIPVFIGDDVTDEAGFETINTLDGISIKVGRGRTNARYRLRSVDDVRSWLAESLSKGSQRARKNGAA